MQIGRECQLESVLGGLVADMPAASRAERRVREQIAVLADIAREHRRALTAYLEEIASGVDSTTSIEATPTHVAIGGAVAASTAVARVQAALAELMAGYGVLTTLAFRLYEQPLRPLAPRCLREYAEASQGLNQALSAVVAAELLSQGLECHCVCPMCAIGACGCVAVSTRHINHAWRESMPPEELDGLVLQRPRPNSQFAVAGLLEGDRLLAVDDRSIRSLNDLMDGIRNHPIGEDVRLRIQRGDGEPQEIVARHVSDY
jgi:small-conductance mechanosensitive channel